MKLLTLWIACMLFGWAAVVFTQDEATAVSPGEGGEGGEEGTPEAPPLETEIGAVTLKSLPLKRYPSRQKAARETLQGLD